MWHMMTMNVSPSRNSSDSLGIASAGGQDPRGWRVSDSLFVAIRDSSRGGHRQVGPILTTAESWCHVGRFLNFKRVSTLPFSGVDEPIAERRRRTRAGAGVGL